MLWMSNAACDQSQRMTWPEQRPKGDSCSYVWREGQLTPVPASRKDVFATRMDLADKRCLWRFLKNASDALQGQGPLKVSAAGSPLVAHTDTDSACLLQLCMLLDCWHADKSS